MSLQTRYLGLSLRTPLVASASPLSKRVSDVRRLEDGGVSALVLFSLFEEQLTLSDAEIHRFYAQGGSYAEMLATMSSTDRLKVGPVEYLDHLHRAKSAVGIPIIASLNGTPHRSWAQYARLVEQAGADAVELNFYFVPTDPDRTSADIEQDHVTAVEAVRKAVKIPIAVKLSPYFTNTANMARRFERAGADGLVLFNRFYQPDIDLAHMEVKPHLLLSTAPERRLPLRWIAILRDQLKIDLAATGGIHQAYDALKMLLVGATTTMLCTTLLTHGPQHARTIEQGIRTWMASRGYEKLDEIRGLLSQKRCADPSAYERAQYIKTLESWERHAAVTGMEELGTGS